MYFQGRRAYNNSFKDDLVLVESKTSRYRSITIDNSKPGTEYSIYVTAFTKKGEGARSKAFTVSTPAKGNSQHHHRVLTGFKIALGHAVLSLNPDWSLYSTLKPDTSKWQTSPFPQSPLLQGVIHVRSLRCIDLIL